MTPSIHMDKADAMFNLSFVPFPTDCLPELTARYVRQAAQGIGCDETYIALPLLAALASAVGNTRVLQVREGWQEPCIVWIMIIGESGTHKTPAMKRALAALQARQMIEMNRYEQAMQVYESELVDYDQAIKAWKRSKHSQCPSKPEPPAMNRLYCQDITVGALAMILANSDRGLLVARDELSGWLSSFDAYKKQGSADAAQWLEMYNGGTLTVDRKTGDQRMLFVPRASVSITGGIQPGVLTSLLGDKHFENGMAARFLLAMPPRKPKRWTDAGVSDEQQSVMDEIFARLWALTFMSDNQPVVCHFDESGKQAYIQFYNEHAYEQSHLTGRFAAAWSKLEAYTVRFALLIHLVRTVEYGSIVPQAVTMIDGESVTAAVRLVRWFGAETLRIYRAMNETAEDRQTRLFMELADRLHGTVTVRDAMRNGPCYGDKSTVIREFNRLARAGYGELTEQSAGPNGGRPSVCFRVTDGKHGAHGEASPSTETDQLIPQGEPP